MSKKRSQRRRKTKSGRGYLRLVSDATPETAIDNTGPTAQRRKRGQLRREIVDYIGVDELTVGHAEGTVLVWRAIDTLGVMAGNGTISKKQETAGRLFQHWFRAAGLDPLRAMDPGAVGGGSWHDPGPRMTGEAARLLDRLGWPKALAARAAFHVLGFEMAIKEWARAERWSGRDLSDYGARQALLRALEELERIIG